MGRKERCVPIQFVASCLVCPSTFSVVGSYATLSKAVAEHLWLQLCRMILEELEGKNIRLGKRIKKALGLFCCSLGKQGSHRGKAIPDYWLMCQGKLARRRKVNQDRARS